MRSYELMYIAKVGDCHEKITEMLAKVISENRGKLQRVDEWGEKMLAYKLQDNEYGFYTLLTFECESFVIIELDRLLRINENALRHMIISKGL